MAKALIMPKFGFTQESAEIVRWLKHDGEPVEAGDPIAEVTTDIVNMEVEATAAGILAGLRYQEGDTVPVTEVIAYILEPGEALPAEGGDGAPGEIPAAAPEAPAAPGEPARSITPLARQVARAQGVDWSQVAGSGPGGRVMRRDLDAYLAARAEPAGKLRASPNARRLAAAQGVDLAAVAGSGPRGRVQGWDVEQAAVQIEPQAAAPVEAPAAGGEQVVALNSVRRLIAERMQRSSQEAPHVYFDAEIDATRLEGLRQRINARLGAEQPAVSLTALLVKAISWALGRHPFLNSRWMDDGIHLLADIHVGVAVAAESGLIVPVLRHADRKGVAQLSAEMNELVGRARESKLRPDDVSGGTFTLTNLGMFGVDRFTAIINPPQTAILAVGRVRKVFVPDENDQPVLRPVMTVTLGADHRVVDGAVAARFLADVREALEHPEMMVL
ncbi:MAG TPA: dihydrolipoamide acetyltransferase family protein [Anaerolineaceae bacterium]|nr:dihydrolipoamide acetyltransferase family protein [Anaerolineaceae bacterium]